MLFFILTTDGRLLNVIDCQDFPWLHWLQQTPSTNTWAIEHENQLHHGDVVFTQQQTAGRGQGDRVWYAPPGVLTASFVLDGIPTVHWPLLSLASGLAVIYAIEDLMPACWQRLRLKWPNDVWYDRRKLAGILCEGSGTRVIVGVGCNRQVDMDALRDSVADLGRNQPISLHLLQTIVPTELSLLESIRHYLLEMAGLLTAQPHQELQPLISALRARDGLQGLPVYLTTAERQWSGLAQGLDEYGRFCLQLATGEIRAFAAGRVTLATAATE